MAGDGHQGTRKGSMFSVPVAESEVLVKSFLTVVNSSPVTSPAGSFYSLSFSPPLSPTSNNSHPVKAISLKNDPWLEICKKQF